MLEFLLLPYYYYICFITACNCYRRLQLRSDLKSDIKLTVGNFGVTDVDLTGSEFYEKDEKCSEDSRGKDFA